MKLFKGGQSTAKPAGPAAANATAPPVAVPQPLAAPAAPAASPAPAAAPAPAPADPDLTAILDANVKEMSEKIAKLTNSLESTETEKQQFEAKLEQMEDRMRKLSALTEMISAQYNPFVGDAPTEREPLPVPEIGLAPPPNAAAPAMADLAPLSLTPPPMEDDEPEQEPLAPLGAFAPPEPVFAPPPADAHEAPAPEEAPEDHPAHVWSVRPGFESSMLMLGWADMLLKNVPTRDHLVDLVNYYHNIGWIGDPARDALLAYADGIAVAPASEPLPDWRASVEVHEKSLLFLEKLKAISRGSR